MITTATILNKYPADIADLPAGRQALAEKCELCVLAPFLIRRSFSEGGAVKKQVTKALRFFEKLSDLCG